MIFRSTATKIDDHGEICHRVVIDYDDFESMSLMSMARLFPQPQPGYYRHHIVTKYDDPAEQVLFLLFDRELNETIHDCHHSSSGAI